MKAIAEQQDWLEKFNALEDDAKAKLSDELEAEINRLVARLIRIQPEGFICKHCEKIVESGVDFLSCGCTTAKVA
jgi:hypothetical protein